MSETTGDGTSDGASDGTGTAGVSRAGLAWFARRAHVVLDEIGEVALCGLTDDEVVESAVQLDRLAQRLEQRRLAVVGEVVRRELPVGAHAPEAGGDETGDAVVVTGPATGQAVRRERRLAQALEAFDLTRAALAGGLLRVEQAAVITTAVEALPVDIGPADRARAEQHLVGEAVRYDAKQLRVLGRHLLDVIAPDLADEHLARQLEAEEERAARATMLSMVEDGHGGCHGRFTIPSLHGAMLTSMLNALANPALPDPIAREDQTGSRVATVEVRGQAFCQLLERYPTDRLPTTGGVTAQVVVTMPIETLEGRLQSAQILGTHVDLSPATARRLACAAGVIPAVLGSTSQVLDLGRRSRLHTRSQRLALAIAQQGLCAVEHCDTPASWADAHHLQPWSHHGTTTLDNGVLLCPRHHTAIHRDDTGTTRLPDGSLRYHRRT